MQDRIGGDAWAVLAAQQAGDLQWLADSGVPQDRRGPMKEVAAQAVRNGRVAWGAEAVVAIPMKSHGRVVAAMVGLEAPHPAGAAEAVPDDWRLAPLVALAAAIGGPLDTATRAQARERAVVDRRPDRPVQLPLPRRARCGAR